MTLPSPDPSSRPAAGAAFETQADASARRTALRRMQALAAGLLVLMLAVAVLSAVWQARAPWLAYVRAFADAALVGACADWFAVVALFRRPLGLPIPHTAILPRNKQRIAQSLGAFIAGNFLAPEEVAPRLARLDVADWLARWLRDETHVELVVRNARAVLPPLRAVAGDPALRRLARRLLRRWLEGLEAAPLAARALESAIRHGQHRALYDRGVAWAADFLDQNRKLIRQKAADQGGGWLGGWVNGKAAEAFVGGLAQALRDAMAPDHAWRGEYEAFLTRLAQRLEGDAETRAACERLKSELLAGGTAEAVLAWLGEQADARLSHALSADDGAVAMALRRALATLAGWLATDQRVRRRVNRWAREAVLNTIVPNRGQIGAFVTDVVARWDTATLVERLELHVGKDLQYIRINGTVVGGLVGLALFAVTKLLAG